MRVKVRSMSALSSTMRMLGWGTRDLFPVRWTPAQRWKKAQRRSDFGFSSGKRGWLAGVALRYFVISDEISRNKAIPAVSSAHGLQLAVQAPGLLFRLPQTPCNGSHFSLYFLHVQLQGLYLLRHLLGVLTQHACPATKVLSMAGEFIERLTLYRHAQKRCQG